MVGHWACFDAEARIKGCRIVLRTRGFFETLPELEFFFEKFKPRVLARNSSSKARSFLLRNFRSILQSYNFTALLPFKTRARQHATVLNL